MKRTFVVLLTAAALVALTACGGSAKPKASELNDRPDTQYAGFGLDPAQPRPQFSLTDTSGKVFNFGQQTAGRPTLLYFGYTRCPDECPATMADIATALRGEPTAIRERTDVVFVTTDVEHDTGPVIAAWLRHFDRSLPNKFIGLRGTQAQVDAAQAAAHVIIAEDGGKTHGTNVLLYGADDYAHVQYLLSNNEAEQIAHDLPLIAAQS